ncbi:hypothetical protein EFL44_10190 [Lactococcus cremoris]|nr:hypothetical protein [Lactococcus cremoris]MCT0467433.1 hypothetical protein [Lactococcus cremoris]MCT4416416.1 hypothetical protein [Lactococcus cremoris]MCT4416999.1 hypothetical protein [Lactococcus cremoris]MCT4432749.1 hypothetical protein [Lactococcus cremoris]PFH00802.1 hypothetical protein BW156_05130 [Lactococcus cremoris]
MKDVLDYIISGISICIFILAVYMIKKIPEMVSDKLKSDREFEFNKELQIDEFYRKDGNLQQIMMNWTELAIDTNAMESLDSKNGQKKLRKLVQETLGYGSGRTVKLLTEMLQESYRSNDTESENTESGNNESENNESINRSSATIMLLLAMVVSSLKEDFTGQKVDPLDVLKIKLTDYYNHEGLFKELFESVNNKLGVEV